MGIGSIYVIQAEGLPFVKVGYTSNFKTRFAALQTSSPVPLRLVDIFVGSIKQEQRIHRALLSYRSPANNEWYECDADKIVEFCRWLLQPKVYRLSEIEWCEMCGKVQYFELELCPIIPDPCLCDEHQIKFEAKYKHYWNSDDVFHITN